MANLHYVVGDATDPIKKPAVIAHVCNSIGAWGRGFVMSLSARSTLPEAAYRDWYTRRVTGFQRKPFRLGEVQFVSYAPGVFVANMIAQEGIRWQGSTPPIRYEALEKCLSQLYSHILYCPDLGGKGYTVHMPRIGCVLAGGDWQTIEGVINKHMKVDTVVYTLPEQKGRWATNYRPIEEVLEEMNAKTS